VIIEPDLTPGPVELLFSMNSQDQKVFAEVFLFVLLPHYSASVQYFLLNFASLVVLSDFPGYSQFVGSKPDSGHYAILDLFLVWVKKFYCSDI